MVTGCWGRVEVALDADALTEGRAVPSGLSSDARRMVAVGAPRWGVELAVTTPEGEPLPPGQVGEIWASRYGRSQRKCAVAERIRLQ